MGGERMPQEVGMHASRFEPGSGCEAAQDEERAGAREWTALSIQEQFRPVAFVEIRAPPGVVASQRVDRLAPDRNDALLGSLADCPDKPPLEIDRCPVEPDGLADSQPCSVEEFDERPVAERPWRRSCGRLDQPLDL